MEKRNCLITLKDKSNKILGTFKYENGTFSIKEEFSPTFRTVSGVIKALSTSPNQEHQLIEEFIYERANNEIDWYDNLIENYGETHKSNICLYISELKEKNE